MNAKNYNNGLCMDIYPCMIKQAKYPLGGLKNHKKLPFLDIPKKKPPHAFVHIMCGNKCTRRFFLGMSKKGTS